MSTTRSILLALALVGCGGDDGLSVVNALPGAEILDPTDGDSVYEGARVVFKGRLVDRDTAPERLRATWFLNGEEACASAPPDEEGTTLCEILIPDAQSAEISLEGLDVGNGSDTDTITVQIEQNSPPTVSLVAPLADTQVYAQAPIPLAALVDDAEDAPEDLLIAWDVDGTPLADAPIQASAGGEVAGETAGLDEGEHTLTITVTDAGGKTAADTTTLQVGPPNTPPDCAILQPADGGTTLAGAALALVGSATDVNVGPAQLLASFSSDVDGPLGAGTPDVDGHWTIEVSDLSLGDHVLSLLVEDEVGAQCTAQVALSVLNTPPMAPIVELTPLDPTSTDDLSVSIALPSFDAEGHTVTYAYAWLKDGVLQPTLTGSTLPAGATRRDEVWTARVTPNDGYVDGEPAEAAVTILNAPPAYFGAAITPSAATESSTLTCHATGGTDPDGDTVTPRFTWQVNGSDVAEGSTLDGSAFDRDDHVTCAAFPQDGLDTGAPTYAAEIVIGDTAPAVSAVGIGPVPLTVLDAPVCTWTFTDIDPRDADQSTRAWEVNGTPAGDGVSPNVALHLGDTVRCSVTASDGTLTGNTASASVSVVNTPPSAPGLAITPADPTTSDALTVTITDPSVDAEGSTVSYSVVWLRDGVLVAGQTAMELPASQTARGEVWTARVTPSDGSLLGDFTETSVTIGNAAPTIASVSVTPVDPVQASTLSCTASGVVDADGDTPVLAYAWTVDGQPAGDTDTLVNTAFHRDQLVICTVTATDGNSTSAAVASDPVLIGNSPPAVANVAIAPSELTVLTPPACSWDFSDPDPADTDQSVVAWEVNGAPAGSGTSPDVSLQLGDAVRCTVTASDGTDSGNSASASAVVVNTAPSAPTIDLTPASPTTVDTLTVSIVDPSVDAEGSPISYRVEWLRDGVLVPSQTAMSLPADQTARDQRWTVRVIASDGSLDSAPVEAAVTVLNTLPSLVSAQVQPDPAYETSTLSCVDAGTVDPDGDAIQLSYQWTVDGLPAGTTATLDGNAFDRDQTVTCAITPADDTGPGATVHAAAITIANSPPVVSNVAIDPITPTNKDIPLCTWSFADADPGDTDQSTVAWTINGNPADTGPTLTAPIQPDDVVECAVTAHDGTSAGNTATASTTINFSGPSITRVWIETVDGGPPTAEHDLVCKYEGFTSPSSGPDRSTVQWYVGNVLVGQGAAWIQPPKLLTGYRRGDLVRCVITPFDSVESGRPVEGDLTILNAAPTTPGITTPGSVTPGQPLTCSVNVPSSDADGDPISYAFTWEVNTYGDTDGDGLSDEIDPLPSDFSYFDSERDFGSVQGRYQWSYQHNNYQQAAWVNSGWDGARARWGGDPWYGGSVNEAGWIDRYYMRSGWRGTRRVWTAPLSGPIHISGRASMAQPTLCFTAIYATLSGPGLAWSHRFNCSSGSAPPASYDFKSNVSAGNAVYLTNTGGNYSWSDTMGFSAKIYLSSPTNDVDSDGVLDEQDRCQYGADSSDLDGNGTPDACDQGWVLFTGANTSANSSTVAAADIAPNETWRCRVVASDGTDNSAAAYSSTRAIP